MHAVDEKLHAMGIAMRDAQNPTANYVLCVRSGNLLHLCGHNPKKEDDENICGKLGEGQDFLTVDQGYEAARWCAINILYTLHQELKGDWSRVKQIVKLVGFVNCTSDFVMQPAVINGASDLFADIFGPSIGRHARSAVGMASLPFGIAVEVECIVEITD
jgi:enamine deaminase RidA (YjgF/YER057c/UK114 family)